MLKLLQSQSYYRPLLMKMTVQSRSIQVHARLCGVHHAWPHAPARAS